MNPTFLDQFFELYNFEEMHQGSIFNHKRVKMVLARLGKEKMGECQYLEALVNSMPRRMANVIERDGNLTKY